jgi:hypothetical protein
MADLKSHWFFARSRYLVLLFSPGPERDSVKKLDVKSATDAYHSALEAAVASKMESLWAHDANVLLVNPADTSVSVGWDAVKGNWKKVSTACRS